MRLACARFALGLVCVLALSRCVLDARVDYEGEYGFGPGSGMVDTNFYPLRHLLIVEDNVDGTDTLVYYFRGELAEADLGYQDLRRLAHGFNRFRMAFETPRSGYVNALRSLDEGARDGTRTPLPVQLNGVAVGELTALSDDGLVSTGTSRYLRAQESSDYRVEAFAGVVEGSLAGGDLAIGGTPVVLKVELARSNPSLARPEDAGMDRRLLLDAGTRDTPDYLRVELLQTLLARETDTPDSGMDAALRDGSLPTNDRADASLDGGAADDAATRREALMRTEMLPETLYGLSQSLVSGAVEQGCWSLGAPLGLRVVQIRRGYWNSGQGDLATILQRLDTRVVPPELWHPLVQDAELLAYCEDYRADPAPEFATEGVPDAGLDAGTPGE